MAEVQMTVKRATKKELTGLVLAFVASSSSLTSIGGGGGFSLGGSIVDGLRGNTASILSIS